MLVATLKRNSKVLSVFTGGQLAIQFLQVITGFMVIRWMNKEDFAQFTLAFGVQNIFGMLVEMGLSSAFLAFIGDKHQDPRQVSRYFNAVWYWRKKLFVAIFPISFIVFVYLTYGKNWESLTLLLLYVSIPLAIYYQGFISFYGVVLRIKNDIASIYIVQLTLALIKLTIVSILYFNGWLNSWMYLLLNTIVIVCTGFLLAPKANSYRDKNIEADEEAYKQVITYIKPSILGISFSAIQSQMTVLLISLFGNTMHIADVGALGRIGQLFTFINAFNSMILQPWFAKMALSKVFKNTILTVATMSIPLGVLVLLAFNNPQVFQYILGGNYDNLGEEFGWSILIAAISYISGIFLLITAAKKWVYWWTNISYVFLFFLINGFGIIFIDLSSVMGILKLSFLFAFSFMILQVIRFLYGLVFGPSSEILHK